MMDLADEQRQALSFEALFHHFNVSLSLCTDSNELDIKVEDTHTL
jgi:hypothetical protein